jgi:hypothetical protein
VEWQAYGVQTTPPHNPLSLVPPQQAETPLLETPWVPEKPAETPAEQPAEQPYAETIPNEPTWREAPSLQPTTGLMAELGPLPDLSDLSSFGALGDLLAHADASMGATPLETPMSELPVTRPQASGNPALSPPAPTVAEPHTVSQSAFEEGQSVQHAKYGRGTIIQVIPTGQRHTLQVQFETAGTRLLDAAQSGLQWV